MVTKSKKTSGYRAEKNFDSASIKTAMDERLVYAVGKEPINATTRDWYTTAAYVVRDRLIDRWTRTMSSYYEAHAKRVYYLSMEFLMGRSLMNSLLNLEVENPTREAL
jgi:starch phosphorylase